MICVNGQEIMYKGTADDLAIEVIGALLTIWDEFEDDELARFTILTLLKEEFKERFEQNE